MARSSGYRNVRADSYRFVEIFRHGAGLLAGWTANITEGRLRSGKDGWRERTANAAVYYASASCPGGRCYSLLTVVNSMHVFDLVKTLTGGGPFYATETVDLYIYNFAFSTSGFPQIGYASAAGIVFGVAIFILTALLGLLVKWLQQAGGRG